MKDLEYLIEYDNTVKNTFFQGMLISVCTLYENILKKISHTENLKPSAKGDNKLKNICHQKNIELSDNSKAYIDFISKQSLIVRNKLIHDGSGTVDEKESEIIERISGKYNDLHFENKYISFTGDTFIIDTLSKIKFVLLEICDKLGYVTKFIKNT